MITPADPRTPAQLSTGEAPMWQPNVDQPEPQTSTVATATLEASADEVPARLHSRSQRPRSTTILLAVAAMVAVGGVAFALGHMTSSGGGSTNGTTLGGANGFPAGQGGFGPNAIGDPRSGIGGPGAGLGLGTATMSGTVVSVGSDSITLKLADGTTVTIATGSSTTYHDQTSASNSDVTVGSSVTVQTSGGGVAPGSSQATASGSPGTNGARTATDVTITGK